MIYTPRIIKLLPQSSGVYEFKNSDGTIIYIGKAINLKSRVSSYFRPKKSGKAKLIALQTDKIEIIEVESEFQALLLEARLINKNKPKYNVIARDDKSFIYIGITKDEYPRVLLSRKRQFSGELFGPFPSSRTAREILIMIRHIFPYCTQKMPAKRICFYNHLDLCNPCPAKIVMSNPKTRNSLKNIYISNIKNIKKILSGEQNNVISNLTKNMKNLSYLNHFEAAATIRDKIKELNIILHRKNYYLDYILANPKYLINSWKAEQENLTSTLKNYIQLPKNTKTVECYDISNIQGRLAAGSLVTFMNGHPDKSRYRHFRIKTKNSPDDYLMLKEVFERRLKHTEWPLPDLIMVDGGAQQLSTLLAALKLFKINIPAISLAKKHEEIYVKQYGKYISIGLPNESPALNFAKRIRDEAHRFALSYHQKLRLKNLFNLL